MKKDVADRREGKCSKIEEERSEEKTLFYCGGELAGSVVLLDEAKKVFGRDLLEKGTKLSTGVEQNFYYSYIHVKL